MKNQQVIQQYDNYTIEDHQVWQILFDRQMKKLPQKASVAFLEGMDHVGFENDKIPDFREVNRRLLRLTGWQLYGVPGIVDNRTFIEMLSQKLFPATTWLRKMEQLDYLEEPDMFHDVFAHVPLLSNKEFCGFLKGLSDIALDHIDDEWCIELLSRVYWYTVEFGLISEKGKNRIYGAGILSSNGETDYSLEEDLPRHTFNVRQILDTPYIKEKFQVEYFVIDSYSQLYGSLEEIRSELYKMAETKRTVVTG